MWLLDLILRLRRGEGVESQSVRVGEETRLFTQWSVAPRTKSESSGRPAVVFPNEGVSRPGAAISAMKLKTMMLCICLAQEDGGSEFDLHGDRLAQLLGWRLYAVDGARRSQPSGAQLDRLRADLNDCTTLRVRTEAGEPEPFVRLVRRGSGCAPARYALAECVSRSVTGREAGDFLQVPREVHQLPTRDGAHEVALAVSLLIRTSRAPVLGSEREPIQLSLEEFAERCDPRTKRRQKRAGREANLMRFARQLSDVVGQANLGTTRLVGAGAAATATLKLSDALWESYARLRRARKRESAKAGQASPRSRVNASRRRASR